VQTGSENGSISILPRQAALTRRGDLLSVMATQFTSFVLVETPDAFAQAQNHIAGAVASLTDV
jgi:hypothetical protein